MSAIQEMSRTEEAITVRGPDGQVYRFSTDPVTSPWSMFSFNSELDQHFEITRIENWGKVQISQGSATIRNSKLETVDLDPTSREVYLVRVEYDWHNELYNETQQSIGVHLMKLAQSSDYIVEYVEDPMIEDQYFAYTMTSDKIIPGFNLQLYLSSSYATTDNGTFIVPVIIPLQPSTGQPLNLSQFFKLNIVKHDTPLSAHIQFKVDIPIDTTWLNLD